ncbi:MAG TPA: sulfotransferase [Woeseiaceae bacterium]|jgi:hypothetical protein|nr:sulfotransferase [Woeseiaceae bacterium]
MIRPIILIGMNRSGTKWVSNIICGHADVIGVQSRRTGGILETNMFGAMQDKFDPAVPDDYIGLVELWARTEFFRRTGLDKDMLYSLSPRPRSVLRLFEVVLDEVARRNGKSYWLQKTSPPNASTVLEHFTNARIVVVRRNLLDTVRSMLGLQSRRGTRSLFRATYRYVYQKKLLDRICRHHPVIEMHYEALRANPESEKARLFARLGLDAGRVSPEDPFPRNTSFASEAQRRDIMPRRDRLLVRVLAVVIDLLPLPVISAAVVLRGFSLGRKSRPLVADTFGELGDRLADRSGGSVHPDR